MSDDEFAKLDIGDIVRGRSSGISYVVVGNCGDTVIAVREINITHPVEWDLVSKVTRRETLV